MHDRKQVYKISWHCHFRLGWTVQKQIDIYDVTIYHWISALLLCRQIAKKYIAKGINIQCSPPPWWGGGTKGRDCLLSCVAWNMANIHQPGFTSQHNICHTRLMAFCVGGGGGRGCGLKGELMVKSLLGINDTFDWNKWERKSRQFVLLYWLSWFWLSHFLYISLCS